ncbi:MAG: serpin family protein [Bryobacteraceae bacterium]
MIRNLKLALPLGIAGILHAAASPAPGLNRFATAGYHELARGSDNLIFSPFSISTALSMLLEGARGQTARQMAGVLHRAYPDAAYPAALASLVGELAKSGNDANNELLIANGLWVQRGFSIQSDFRQTIQTVYGAPLTPLDFLRDIERARAEINTWTDQHTKGKISELYPPGSLDPNARVILTSAIYFHGKWKLPFQAQDTRPAPFRLGAKGSVPASLMNQTGTFGYAETPSAQILQMRYAGTPLAFVVLLPKEVDGLPQVEQSITAEFLSRNLAELKDRTVEVAVPKFRAESEFSLRGALARLGMPDAFTGSADFSGIDDRRDLLLSDVRHKAFVDVSEEGTEAAAASGGMVTFVAMQHQPRTVFRADHPFAFLIRDTRSGAILFGGRLTKPEA